MKRSKTDYPGVYYIEGKCSVKGHATEKIYYIAYRKSGNTKLIEEKAGRQYKDDMTPAKAAGIRAARIQGKELSNEEAREAKREEENKELPWTINRLWNEYRETKAMNKSLDTDLRRYDKFIKETLGSKLPSEILRLDIDRLRLKDLKGLAPQTVKHVLALIKRICSFGINKGLCAGIPFKIEMPKVDNILTEDLTEEQANNLMTVLTEYEDAQVAHIMLMAIYTGMRRGELFKLQWNDVQFERGFIVIRDPKGGKDARIPLNQAAREILESHPRIKGKEHIFIRKDGKPFTDITRHTKVIKVRAGLPEAFRPMHGLRHYFATMLAASGQVDMYTLQRLLTHKSPVMTQRYAHLRDEALKAASSVAVDVISDIMNRENVKAEEANK